MHLASRTGLFLSIVGGRMVFNGSRYGGNGFNLIERGEILKVIAVQQSCRPVREVWAPLLLKTRGVETVT